MRWWGPQLTAASVGCDDRAAVGLVEGHVGAQRAGARAFWRSTRRLDAASKLWSRLILPPLIALDSGEKYGPSLLKCWGARYSRSDGLSARDLH